MMGQVTRKRRICSRLYCIYIYVLKRARSIDFMLMQNRFSASKSPQCVSWYWVRFVCTFSSLSLRRSFNASLHKKFYHVKVVCSVQNPINIWSNVSVLCECVDSTYEKKRNMLRRLYLICISPYLCTFHHNLSHILHNLSLFLFLFLTRHLRFFEIDFQYIPFLSHFSHQKSHLNIAAHIAHIGYCCCCMTNLRYILKIRTKYDYIATKFIYLQSHRIKITMQLWG